MSPQQGPRIIPPAEVRKSPPDAPKPEKCTAMLGPFACVLTHDDGVHRAANGVQWIGGCL